MTQPAPDTALVPATTDATALIAQAIANNTPVETMERLLAMKERLDAAAAKSAFLAALTLFQSECPVLRKTATATIVSAKGTFKYSYAPLDEIAKAIAPLLARHGLSYRFDAELLADPLAQRVVCIVTHVDGHSERSTFTTPIDTGARMNVAQQGAAALTYSKRYCLCNGLGITSGDDDNDARTVGLKPTTDAPTDDDAAPTLRQPAKGDIAFPTDAEMQQPAAFRDPGDQPPKGRQPKDRKLTAKERGSLFGVLKKSQRSEEQFRAYLDERWGLDTTKDIRMSMTDEIGQWLQAGETEVAGG